MNSNERTRINLNWFHFDFNLIINRIRINFKCFRRSRDKQIRNYMLANKNKKNYKRHMKIKIFSFYINVQKHKNKKIEKYFDYEFHCTSSDI